MDPILSFAHSHQERIIGLIRALVECESPSGDTGGIDRFIDLLSDVLAPMGRFRLFKGGHLLCEFDLPGNKKAGRILALGHSDTVWPMGTLTGMPFKQEQGRLWGPGVLDMKSGIAFFIFAIRAILELDIPVAKRVALLVSADEEIGSETSRAIIEREAKRSQAVLVLEPGTGLEGRVKTARKGVGHYRVKVTGKASHAGVDFTQGASAIVELARQIDRIAQLTNLERGTTVNPGVVSGGTRSNVIAAEASAEVDFRVARLKDATPLDKKFRSLKPFDKRCRVEVSGGLNRPPMERTAGVVSLFRLAQQAGKELGVRVEESSTGGGSDGNFTAALGVPTLDGLGGVGEGAHATHESILIDRIADRTALLAKLITAIR